MLEKLKTKLNRSIVLAFSISCLFGFINFFYFCTHNALSPDAVGIGTQHIAGGWEIALGRWGLVVPDLLRGGIVNEWLITAISVILLSVSVCLIIDIFNIKKKISIIALAAIVVFFPVFAETALYVYCFDSYCYAFFFSILAVFLFKNLSGKIKYVFPAMCVLASLSLYQAYLGVTIGLVFVIGIVDILTKKDSFRKVARLLLKYVLTIAAAVLVYYVITKIISKVTHHPLASYKNANSSIFDVIKSCFDGISTAYSDFVSFLFSNSHHPIRIALNCLIVLLVVFRCGVLVVKKKINIKNVVLIALLFALLPVVVNILDVITVGNKMNLLTYAPMLSVYVLAIVLYDDAKYQKICFLVSLILSYEFFLSNQATFMARHDIYQNYYFLASDIISKVQNIKDYDENKSLCFNYIIEYDSPLAAKSNNYIAEFNENTEDFHGLSNTPKFYKRYLGKNVNFCTRAEYDSIVNTDIFQEMPSYPADGSIRVFDNVIFVKLNNKHF